jgi:hypothetical protein
MPVQARDLSEAEVVEDATQFEPTLRRLEMISTNVALSPLPAVLPDRENELGDYFQCAGV